MVDFKYHVISLTAVFIALAIGIVLGAGPLQGYIGATLENQVKSISEERNNAREQLDVATTDLDETKKYLDNAVNQLIPETLTGRKVAVVIAPGADKTSYELVKQSLDNSGAKVVSLSILKDALVSQDTKEYRSSFAGQFADKIKDVDTNTSATNQIAYGFNQILRNGLKDDENISVFSESMLSVNDEKSSFLSYEIAPEEGADVILFVVPNAVADDEETKFKNRELVGIFSTIASQGPVVAIGDATEGSVLESLQTLQEGSTVSGSNLSIFTYNVVLAIAHEINKEHADYGVGGKANKSFADYVKVSVK